MVAVLLVPLLHDWLPGAGWEHREEADHILQEGEEEQMPVFLMEEGREGEELDHEVLVPGELDQQVADQEVVEAKK